jgi:cytochrome b561
MATMARAPRSRYSTVAIALHWAIALLVTSNLAAGLLLETVLDSPDTSMQAIGGVLINLHKSFGLTVLALTLARIGWRLANPAPPLPGFMTTAEVIVSRFVHFGFYALLLLIPLSGWAYASTDKVIYPLSWFWLVPVPMLPLPQSLHDNLGSAHEVMAFSAIALLVLHVGAALKHHYLDRDNLLARMWLSRR